ncbi:fasciclin domain-containing protein [Mycolicibacterium sp. S2-37]|uniref:fasciclin domain-containing protein n=1 Tax=Mycolicibacterium sp. S2-37 TaxID=2810297 RepID=UPI001A94A186|nr:fasciclin domain-containing protein [Mycolicibacterium sp. S2-37]MBO0679524.1 fasciclin domain-containing protein [Mycolicibacterium sp. S2-37]
MNTRIKTVGAAVGIAAIAVSLPLSFNASAQPTQPSTVETPLGPLEGDCDPFRAANPNWKSFATQPVSQVLAQIPDISTFSSAISGGLNPAVNVAPVLDNGPYVVFAPTNEAFAKLPPEQLEALKNNPAALTDLDYYHVFLGLLGPADVKGQRPTQQGAELNIEGTNGDIKVNETAKVICGGISAANARIYLIDTVLDPANAPTPLSPTPTSSTSTTSTTATSTTAPPTPLPAETPAPAPAG